MSQRRSPTTDTQTRLQSMLQRLTLQPAASAADRGPSGGRGAPVLQTAGRGNSIPVNGFGAARTDDITSEPKEEGRGQLGNNNGNPGKVQEARRIPAWGSKLGRPAVSELETQKDKDNTDSDRGEDMGVEQAGSPAVTPTGTGRLLPANSPKDAEDLIVKDGVTDGRVSLPDASPLTSGTPPQTQEHNSSPTSVQAFTPRVYTWSLNPAEANLDTESQERKVLHLGNGDVGGSKDTEARTANSTPADRKAKRRPSQRWTQKIKERWRERHGSLGKKRKEEGGGADVKSETEKDCSPPKQPPAAETVINTWGQEGGRTPCSLDESDQGDTPAMLSHTQEDTAADGHIRSTSDFEFCLGSFSLLEEIVTGQEWAKFLNPTLSGVLTNQGASEQSTSQQETTPQPQHRDGGQPPAIPNIQWSFRENESPAQMIDLGMAPISVNMDISEANHMPGQGVQCEAGQSEPMEHGHTQSDMESEESGPGLQRTPEEDFSHIKSADILDNSAMKSRVQLNRKRAHQMSERREAERDDILSSPSTATICEGTELKDDNDMISLYPTKSSLSPSSSSTPRIIAVPRSVLKHSISQDSQSSVSTETVTKKRRVEEGRRVRFSEAVETIAPVCMDADDTDSEEDSGTDEEDSVVEEEVGMEQAVEALAPPRPALPAWILALKRMKTGRKHRQ